MKILIFADASNPHTEKWLRFYYDRKIDVEIATLIESGFPNIPVHLLRSVSYQKRKNNREYNRLKVFWEVYPQLKGIVNKVQPDIVHAHYASSFGLYASITGFHPFILSVWGSDITDFPNRSLFNRFLIRHILSKADFICSSSEYLSEATKKYTSREPYLIYFGVDTKQFKPLAEFKKDQDKFIFGTVKALDKHYGINYLIEAASLINQQIPNWELWIGGEGTEKDHLKNLVKQLNIDDKVRFLGYIPHFKVPEVLDQLDVFIVPSLEESFGVAAAEASACQLPVIASAIGGLPEIIVESETGYLVKPGSAVAIAEKLIHLYRNPNLRMEMGKAGRENVKAKFEWQINADKMINIYEKILRKKL